MENKDLRQKYFMSVGRSLKLQTTMNGGYINISVADLYEQALHRSIPLSLPASPLPPLSLPLPSPPHPSTPSFPSLALFFFSFLCFLTQEDIKIEEWPNWISDNLANSFLNASKWSFIFLLL